MILPGSTYYFVHEAHPAIHMLRASQDELGAQLSSEGDTEGQWYKVEVCPTRTYQPTEHG